MKTWKQIEKDIDKFVSKNFDHQYQGRSHFEGSEDYEIDFLCPTQFEQDRTENRDFICNVNKGITKKK